MTSYSKGDAVAVAIFESGPARCDVIGTIEGIVLNAGAEIDVIVSPGADLDEVDALLHEADMALSDLREGPVYVLRNCQPEWIRSAS